MDLAGLQNDNSYIFPLFGLGIIGRGNLINLDENEEFCHNEWNWYKIPTNMLSQMKGQKNIIYLEMELKTGTGVEIWIPFRRVPKISFSMKCRTKIHN